MPEELEEPEELDYQDKRFQQSFTLSNAKPQDVQGETQLQVSFDVERDRDTKKDVVDEDEDGADFIRIEKSKNALV